MAVYYKSYEPEERGTWRVCSISYGISKNMQIITWMPQRLF